MEHPPVMQRHLPRLQCRDIGIALVNLDGDLLTARQKVVIGESVGVRESSAVAHAISDTRWALTR
jgi:hypothetical protein